MSTKYLVVFFALTLAFLGVIVYTACSRKFKAEVEEVVSMDLQDKGSASAG